MNLNERFGVTLQNLGLFACLAGLYMDGFVLLYIAGSMVFLIGALALRNA